LEHRLSNQKCKKNSVTKKSTSFGNPSSTAPKKYLFSFLYKGNEITLLFTFLLYCVVTMAFPPIPRQFKLNYKPNLFQAFKKQQRRRTKLNYYLFISISVKRIWNACAELVLANSFDGILASNYFALFSFSYTHTQLLWNSSYIPYYFAYKLTYTCMGREKEKENELLWFCSAFCLYYDFSFLWFKFEIVKFYVLLLNTLTGSFSFSLLSE